MLILFPTGILHPVNASSFSPLPGGYTVECICLSVCVNSKK